MSILIKGINPPSCCKSCQLIAWNNDAGFYCAALSDNLVKCACSMDGSKRGDCPLVEIPEPHGRLIDADALKTKLNNIHDFLLGDCEFSELAMSDKARIDELTNCIAEIVNAPTAMESERSKRMNMDKDIEEIIEKVMFELRDRIDGLMNDSYGNMYDEGVLDAIDIINKFDIDDFLERQEREHGDNKAN